MSAPAEDLVRRAVGTALITLETYDLLVVGARDDVRTRLQLRFAEYARDAGKLETWTRHLRAAIERVRGGDGDDEPQPR